jgi:hypothetical protein
MTPEPKVTAHAVVRYLERALEFDVEALRTESGLHRHDDMSFVAWLEIAMGFPISAIRRQIADYVAPALGMGIHRLPFDGVVLCLTGETVTTVLPADGMKRSRIRRRAPRDFREMADSNDQGDWR